MLAALPSAGRKHRIRTVAQIACSSAPRNGAGNKESSQLTMQRQGIASGKLTTSNCTVRRHSSGRARCQRANARSGGSRPTTLIKMGTRLIPIEIGLRSQPKPYSDLMSQRATRRQFVVNNTEVSLFLSFLGGAVTPLASLRGETFDSKLSGCARKFNIFLDKAATCGGTRLDASPALLSSLY